MMYSAKLIIIYFCIVLYKTSQAAVAIYPKEDKPPELADQEGCFLSSLKCLLEVGVPYSPHDGVSCEQYVCNDNGETQLFTCGAIAVGSGCIEIEGNKTLPYPECCNLVRCFKEDGTYTDF